MFGQGQTFSPNILTYEEMFECLATSVNKACSSGEKQQKSNNKSN